MLQLYKCMNVPFIIGHSYAKVIGGCSFKIALVLKLDALSVTQCTPRLHCLFNAL